MKRYKQILMPFIIGILMLLAILDGKTVFSGAKDGITLCLYTVIPSLFPFFILSILLNSYLIGKQMSILHPINRLCGIPFGAESILLLSFLGGYPVGAQAVAHAYERGQLPQSVAHRMLGFCNNAGPSFLFGMLTSLFSRPWIPWILWGIHILSALIVGALLPNKVSAVITLDKQQPLTLSSALSISIRNMANVCGWIVIFRIVITVLKRWILILLPLDGQVFLCGLLELSNGCILLRSLQEEGARFIYSTFMLAFGGLCVGMQTLTAVEGLGSGMYFPGKAIQAAVSTCLSCIIQPFIFPPNDCLHVSPVFYICMFLTGSAVLLCIRRKKVVALLAEI